MEIPQDYSLEPDRSYFEIEWDNANELRQDDETSPLAWAPYLAVASVGLFISSPRQTAERIYDELKQLREPKKDELQVRLSPRNAWLD